MPTRALLLLTLLVTARAHAGDVPPGKGSPNGLWWDSRSQTLYVADEENARLLITHGDKERVLPIQGATTGLGQVIRLDDGTLAVVGQGHGGSGTIYLVTENAAAKEIGGLTADRH